MSIPDILATTLMLAIVGVLAIALSHVVRLPSALLMALCGFGFSFLLTPLNWDTGIRADNFQQIMGDILLPILIFKTALALNLSSLRTYLLPIISLSTLGLIFSTGIVAIVLYYGIGHPTGFPFIAALITGAMISATVPSAVVEELNKAQAPKELGTILEGESLFNDAAAIVLFTVLMGLAIEGNMLSGMQITQEFFLVLIGGVVSGLVVCPAFWLLRKLLPEDTLFDDLCTLLLAYSSFYIAKHIFGVSGIMALVSTAILYKSLEKDDVCNGSRSQIWDILGLFASMFTFVVMGLVFAVDMFQERWLAMLLAIGAALLARVVSVYCSTGIVALFKQPMERSYPPVIIWGGVRGAVTIALVLSIPVELDYWWTIQSIGFGVVLFTLLFQATTTRLLLQKLKLI